MSNESIYIRQETQIREGMFMQIIHIHKHADLTIHQVKCVENETLKEFLTRANEEILKQVDKLKEHE